MFGLISDVCFTMRTERTQKKHVIFTYHDISEHYTANTQNANSFFSSHISIVTFASVSSWWYQLRHVTLYLAMLLISVRFLSLSFFRTPFIIFGLREVLLHHLILASVLNLLSLLFVTSITINMVHYIY